MSENNAEVTTEVNRTELAMGDDNAEVKAEDSQSVPIETTGDLDNNKEHNEADEPASKKQKVTNSVPESPKKERGVRNSSGRNAGRLSAMEKVAKEGEELLKELGHKDEGQDTDRRRTRSQTRGGPAVTPVKTPKPKKAPSSSSGGRRGRPRKEDKAPVEVEEKQKETKTEELNNSEEKTNNNNDTKEDREEENEEDEPAKESETVNDVAPKESKTEETVPEAVPAEN